MLQWIVETIEIYYDRRILFPPCLKFGSLPSFSQTLSVFLQVIVLQSIAVG